MDGAIGSSTGNFWLFGGTGDFNRISEIDDGMSLMDNIVYGIRDFDFPYFVPHPNYPLPISGEADFVSKSMEALEAEAGVPTIEDLDLCIDYPLDILKKRKFISNFTLKKKVNKILFKKI